MPGLKSAFIALVVAGGSAAACAQAPVPAAQTPAVAAPVSPAHAQAQVPVPHHHPWIEVAPQLVPPPVVHPLFPAEPSDPSPPAPLSDTPDLHWANGPPGYVHDAYFARSAWGARVAVPPSDHPQQWRTEVWSHGPLWFVVELDGAPDQLLCLRWHGGGDGIAREECQAMPAGSARLAYASPPMGSWAGGTYRAELVIVPDADSAMDDGEALATLSFAAGGYGNTIAYIGNESKLPRFPWPPPRFTSKTRIDRQWLVGPDGTLGDAAARLDAAIVQAGYEAPGYYAIPGGFAMATRMEQIEADGTPVDEAQRWSTGLPPPKISSLGDYLSALLSAREGYYRVIVFTFSDQPVAASSVKASEADANDWAPGGADRLPDGVARQPFSSNHRCLVLVYEFRKLAGSNPTANPDGAPPALVHLERSGILAALQP